MIYQLNSLEKWVRFDIHPEIILQRLTDTNLKNHISFAHSEKEIACTYFLNKAIGKEPVITMKFIYAHQVGINSITDLIATYIHSTEYQLTKEIVTFYLKICSILEDLLQFIHQHLPEYFDTNIAISYYNARQSRSDLRKKISSLHPILENATMDNILFRVVLQPFRQFLEEDSHITYRELEYLMKLSSSLKDLLDADDSIDLTFECHIILLQLNFNSPRFVLHYSYWLNIQISQIPERKKQLDKLSWYINSIEQTRYDPDFFFNPKLPSLREQLLQSIRNTHQYLFTEEIIKSKDVVSPIVRNKTQDKIRLSISMPVLALIIKVMVKAGIILNENRSEIFRVVVNNFTTQKSDSISYGSLKRKSNKTPASAYLDLQKTFAKMTGLLKEL
ncbi:hypothetical protein ACE38W_00805 [Chitinophaga sp. Hz27]|uniref:hypothetical protein n=1 Tax=Chitinophaga sp. Hz27 TaxID=3347169 RepID=UPI0035E07027